MEKIKKIKGAQIPVLPSNNAGLEVIRVCKVYDWVVTTEFAQQDVIIPGTVGDTATPLGLIAQAVSLGQSVTITCSAPTVPASVFPLAPSSCGASVEPTPIIPAPPGGCTYPAYPPCPSSPSCTGVIVARNVPIPGRPGVTGAIVKLIQTIPVTFNVFIGNCPRTAALATCNPCPATTFICNVQVRTQVVVCLPDLLDERNINCRAFNLQCNTSGMIFNGNAIDVELTVCKEVQVEAEVKLEVLGKFAQPRPEIPLPPAGLCPPVVEFPPQCPSLYPIPNCTCQGAVLNTTDGALLTEVGVGATVGTATIDAAICPECNPAGSYVRYEFDPGLYPIGSFRVSFTADFTDPIDPATLVCTPVGATGATLSIGGTGVLNVNGAVRTDVPFTLVLTRTSGTPATCSYTLFINTTAGVVAILPGIPAYTTTVVLPSCTELTIRGCATLPPVTAPPIA